MLDIRCWILDNGKRKVLPLGTAKIKNLISVVLLASCILHLASDVWACAVCFGEGNSDLARGFYWGILLLLLLPFILIATIGTKIFLASRKGTHSQWGTSQENSTPAVE